MYSIKLPPGSRSKMYGREIPSFIARPMSPLSFSFPDMKSIWPEALPESMSSQSGPDICSVRLGFGADPAETWHAPSLMTAFQVPPPSPLMSYWITALVPVALSARNRLAIMSKVSFTVGIACLLGWSEGEQIHSAGDGQDRPRDVAGALGTQEGDRVRDILGLALPLHRDALDHPVVERAQAGVGPDDPGRDHVRGDVVTRPLQRHRAGEPDHPHLRGGVGGLAEAAHEPGDRRHADDPAPPALPHAGEDRPRHVIGAGEVDAQVEVPVLVLHVLELGDRVDEAGVVDADVDGPELALDLAGDGGDLPSVGDVARVGPGPAPDLPRCLRGALGVEVDDRDPAALGGERLGVRPPEAAGRSRDASDLPRDAEVHPLRVP